MLTPALLSIEKWDELDPAEKTKIARNLRLNAPLTFRELRLILLSNNQTRHMAIYEGCDGEFVLLPGAEMVLGYDPERLPALSPAQLRRYNKDRRDFHLPELSVFLRQSLWPTRTVHIMPFLIETKPFEVTLYPNNDPNCDPLVALRRGRVWRPHPEVFCRASTTITLPRLQSALEASGLSLPTHDEWEYACRGLARTLYHWGDFAPSDCYPTDSVQFRAHLEPNNFGLVIASDPYKIELTTTSRVTGGGDGGAFIFEEAGFFLGWFTLACSYRNNTEPLLDRLSGEHVRRVCHIKGYG